MQYCLTFDVLFEHVLAILTDINSKKHFLREAKNR